MKKYLISLIISLIISLTLLLLFSCTKNDKISIVNSTQKTILEEDDLVLQDGSSECPSIYDGVFTYENVIALSDSIILEALDGIHSYTLQSTQYINEILDESIQASELHDEFFGLFEYETNDLHAVNDNLEAYFSKKGSRQFNH